MAQIYGEGEVSLGACGTTLSYYVGEDEWQDYLNPILAGIRREVFSSIQKQAGAFLDCFCWFDNHLWIGDRHHQDIVYTIMDEGYDFDELAENGLFGWLKHHYFVAHPQDGIAKGDPVPVILVSFSTDVEDVNTAVTDNEKSGALKAIATRYGKPAEPFRDVWPDGHYPGGIAGEDYEGMISGWEDLHYDPEEDRFSSKFATRPERPADVQEDMTHWAFPPGKQIGWWIYQDGHYEVTDQLGHDRIAHLFDMEKPFAAGWISREGHPEDDNGQTYIAPYSGSFHASDNTAYQAQQEAEAVERIKQDYPDALVWRNSWNEALKPEPRVSSTIQKIDSGEGEDWDGMWPDERMPILYYGGTEDTLYVGSPGTHQDKIASQVQDITDEFGSESEDGWFKWIWDQDADRLTVWETGDAVDGGTTHSTVMMNDWEYWGETYNETGEGEGQYAWGLGEGEEDNFGWYGSYDVRNGVVAYQWGDPVVRERGLEEALKYATSRWPEIYGGHMAKLAWGALRYIKTKDGQEYRDDQALTHYEIMVEHDIDPDDVVDLGSIVDGEHHSTWDAHEEWYRDNWDRRQQVMDEARGASVTSGLDVNVKWMTEPSSMWIAIYIPSMNQVLLGDRRETHHFTMLGDFYGLDENGHHQNVMGSALAQGYGHDISWMDKQAYLPILQEVVNENVPEDKDSGLDYNERAPSDPPTSGIFKWVDTKGAPFHGGGYPFIIFDGTVYMATTDTDHNSLAQEADIDYSRLNDDTEPEHFGRWNPTTNEPQYKNLWESQSDWSKELIKQEMKSDYGNSMSKAEPCPHGYYYECEICHNKTAGVKSEYFRAPWALNRETGELLVGGDGEHHISLGMGDGNGEYDYDNWRVGCIFNGYDDDGVLGTEVNEFYPGDWNNFGRLKDRDLAQAIADEYTNLYGETVHLSTYERMMERWDEHQDAKPYVYYNGKVYIEPNDYDEEGYEINHNFLMLKALGPEAEAAHDKWVGGNIGTGRVFPDGEVVPWREDEDDAEEVAAVQKEWQRMKEQGIVSKTAAGYYHPDGIYRMPWIEMDGVIYVGDDGQTHYNVAHDNDLDFNRYEDPDVRWGVISDLYNAAKEREVGEFIKNGVNYENVFLEGEDKQRILDALEAARAQHTAGIDDRRYIILKDGTEYDGEYETHLSMMFQYGIDPDDIADLGAFNYDGSKISYMDSIDEYKEWYEEDKADRTSGMFIQRWIYNYDSGKAYVNNGDDATHYALFARAGEDHMDPDTYDRWLSGYIDPSGAIYDVDYNPVDEEVLAAIKKAMNESGHEAKTADSEGVDYPPLRYIRLTNGELITWPNYIARDLHFEYINEHEIPWEDIEDIGYMTEDGSVVHSTKDFGYEDFIEHNLRPQTKVASDYEVEDNGRVKYPRTLHLPWSPGSTDDDLFLEDIPFKENEVIVTEKMDGENTTMYTDHIHARSLDSGYHPTRTMVNKLHGEIGYQIPEGWRVCGENMQGQHSIQYTLDSPFYVFAVFDESNNCLSWDDTVEVANMLGLPTVPVLYRGPWDEVSVRALDSSGSNTEGYVVRNAGSFPFAAYQDNVAKYVREDHVQTDEHWMQNPQFNTIEQESNTLRPNSTKTPRPPSSSVLSAFHSDGISYTSDLIPLTVSAELRLLK